MPSEASLEDAARELHIFADASEQAHGAVAYMRTEDADGHVHLSFILACSRVAPKRLHSIPRLELCAALVTAQLAAAAARSDSSTVQSLVAIKSS